MMARGRPEGLALLPSDGAGAWRSFRAMAICLPAFLALRLIGWEGGAPPGGLLTGLVAETAAYVLAWSALLLGTLPIAEAAGAGPRWARFVAAWNWANVPQYAVLLVAIVLPGLLGLPEWFGQAATLAAFGWALWLEWWVAKTALGAGPGVALAIVAADVMIGLVVGGITEKLTG
ncbi:hypothetical protein C8P66_12731 [Humitalea rosea]|uniref:Yip1-like protein n=1 Tax=Humitalea rosea TaxID=990373 RepID=A0A2W7I0I3_9PROT|nr:hypothetical protein [Humitalea rosea]PZW39828.1 hypothetical protein C8P66_12731 [Humitalea rosea]